jgi:hypothetical protein
VFLRAPRTAGSNENAAGGDKERRDRADRLRSSLAAARWSGMTLSRVLQQTRHDLALRREVFLREGYLFAETPGVAIRLSESLRYDHLFDAPRILVTRGGQRFTLERRKGIYVHPEAPAQAERLLLFDRIGLPEEQGTPSLHFSLQGLAEEQGFSSARVTRLTSEGALVELDYAGVRVRAVLDVAQVEARLRCEDVPPAEAGRVAFAKDWSLRRQKAFQRLRAAIDAMVDEALPFDEPKTEIGQQDGQLRPEWVSAYRRGLSRFEFNGDEYPVFDGRGQPRVPQVCVDFITDAFERAGGGWWAPKGEARQRRSGAISFRKLGIENSRSVENLANFAWATPEWFDVVWLPREERIPFAKRQQFFEHLATHAHRYQPGDVILIYGKRSDDRDHYHSFFVYESDPVSGAPTLVAANAGRPRVRSWEAEMQNAPKRSIVARLRPRLSFLERLLSSPEPLEAPRRARWVAPTDDSPELERDDVSAASDAGPG